MKDSIKTGAVSLIFSLAPSLSFINGSELQAKNVLKNQVNAELSVALKSFDINESSDVYCVEPKLVIDAILGYFDEEVKKFKLSGKAREKIVSILSSYLGIHPILIVGSEGKMQFVIDDKKEFVSLVKQLVNVIIDDMPFIVRKVGIPLFFGGNNGLQQKLDNLDETLMFMKEKQYKDVIFDYVGGIVKRVAKLVNGKMLVNDYYDDVIHSFPNKNSSHIYQELIQTGNNNVDIKEMEYPFKD